MNASSLTKLALTIVVAAATVSFAAWLCTTKEPKMPRVHKLEQPLMLSGTGADGQRYLLPAGTSLYYDQAYPEGFVRYKVYVNVEGVKLESKESTEQFWLEPLTAYPVDADVLKKLLREYPLTKADLAAILGSGNLSKEDIRELLLEYSR